MVNYDETAKIASPDVLRKPSAPLVLPATTTSTLAVQPTLARPQSRLDGLLLTEQDQREFKLAMIWIFLSILLTVSALIAILLFVPITL